MPIPGLGVDGLDSDNAVFGNLLATERTRAVRAAAGWSVARDKRSVSISGSLSHGIDMLGARVTYPGGEGFPEGHGGVQRGAADRQAQRRCGCRRVANIRATGCRRPNAIRSAARRSVRAFDTALLDRRLAARAGWPSWRTGRSRGDRFGQSEDLQLRRRRRGRRAPAARRRPRLDYAARLGRGSVPGGSATQVELGLEAARSIDDPYPGFDDDWRFSVAYRLTL